MRAIVALAEARPETIIEDYQRVITLAGLARLLGDDPVTLVPRQGPSAWTPGAGSPPWQVDGVLTWLAGQGSSRDRSPVVLGVAGELGAGDLEGWGWPDVMVRHGADRASTHFRGARSFRPEPQLPALQAALPRGLELPSGMRGRLALLMPVPALVADRPVSGALDLLQDLLAPGLGSGARDTDPEILGDVIRFAGQALPGLGVVMDAVHWQVGRGRCVARNILLAGTDPVAVDAVAARLAGRDPERDVRFRYCRDEGLGAVREGDIKLAGRVDLAGLDFGVPEKSIGGPLPQWLDRTVGRALGRVGKKSSDTQRHSRTPWGRLFADYRAPGSAGD